MVKYCVLLQHSIWALIITYTIVGFLVISYKYSIMGPKALFYSF